MVDDRELYSYSTTSPVLCLCNYNKRANDFSHTREMLYGTRSGLIGCVRLDRGEGVRLWDIEGNGSVAGICLLDFTGNGVNDICVGRETGEI